MSTTLQSLRYTRGKLSVLDQLRLPDELVYIDVLTIQDAWDTVVKMQVRGAPLIAMVSALGLAVDALSKRDSFEDASAAAAYLNAGIAHLRTSRPTAVNLFQAATALEKLVAVEAAKEGATGSAVVDAVVEAAEAMLEEDVRVNKAIGDHGARHILDVCRRSTIRVLTICNTGSLATAGYGTALGVVRSLHALGKLEHVYACETRPYNQGARLTAFEIVEDGLPGTLITDSMASYLMASKGVDVVVVGADRVAANGDTANKIGTYQLAIVAQYHGVPFFTAVPTTTLDLSMASGAEIHVEERPAHEMKSLFGHKLAPDGINVWNPSFDVTPSSLIRGVITEVGVVESPIAGGIIDIASFLHKQNLSQLCTHAVTPVDAPTGYRRLDERGVAEYVVGLTATTQLLQTTSVDQLSSAEVGDGNLNYVYIVSNKDAPPDAAKKIVVKQALPYVRCVGESWPLTLERATFEYNALVEERKLAPQYVPEVYHFDKKNALIVMRFVEPPNQILRKSLIAGLRITTFAAHLADFCSRTLFGSSGLALSGGELRLRVSQWSRNTAMCALTEKVIFTDPYTSDPLNHWTSPHLDSFALSLRTDIPLKLAASALKEIFLTKTQALLHADLHSGSVMVSEGTTFVIDPEFAFYGPMGFDLGALLSNLLLSYFSHAANQGVDYANFVKDQIVIFYEEFERLFLSLWDTAAAAAAAGGGGSGSGSGAAELYGAPHFQAGEAGGLAHAQQLFMRQLWWDALGFTGMKMIRRIVGIAHVADLESIADPDARSACEKRSLALARRLVLASQPQSPQDWASRDSLQNVRGLAHLAESFYSAPPPESLA